MQGGFKSSYTPPCFSDVEPHRLHLLQQLQNGGLDFDVQDYCGLVGQLGSCTTRTDLWLPFPAEGQTFADFARRSGATSQRWMSAVLAAPPVLDSEICGQFPCGAIWPLPNSGKPTIFLIGKM